MNWQTREFGRLQGKRKGKVGNLSCSTHFTGGLPVKRVILPDAISTCCIFETGQLAWQQPLFGIALRRACAERASSYCQLPGARLSAFSWGLIRTSCLLSQCAISGTAPGLQGRQVVDLSLRALGPRRWARRSQSIAAPRASSNLSYAGQR